MATSGSGTMTPVSGAAPGVSTIAQPLPYTLLSLNRYAQIMGINPVHFWGATGDSVGVWPLRNRCADLWPQYSWQYADGVSRYDLALAIRQAEEDLAGELGWWPAPTWVYQEIRPFPRHHRRDVYRHAGRNVRLQRASLHTRWGKVIQAGRRDADPLGTPTVAYSDQDSDGWAETATVSLSTALTDASEIKIYVAGRSGAQEWEIRPPRAKSISGGTFTAAFWSWQLINPDLWEAVPTPDNSGENFQAIDIGTTANFLATVDIYREHTPTDEVSCQFCWEPRPRNLIMDGFCTSCGGAGCEACALTVQNGCLHVRDAERGAVVPEPASYDSDLGQWIQETFSECRDPDFVRIWYYAGAMDQGWLAGANVADPLPRKWANAIAWMATARLKRPFCSCGNVTALCTQYQQDLAAISATDKQAQSYNIDPSLVLQCPFGTRFGEVMAWREVQGEKDRVVRGGVI